MKDRLFWGNRRVMLLHKKSGKSIILYVTIFAVIFIFANCIAAIFSFPEEINVIQGQSTKLNDSFIFSLVLDNNNQNHIDLKNASEVMSSFTMIYGNNQGKINGKVKLFNLLPIKNVALNVMPDLKLIPSGEAIGVKIEAKGVLVVGMSSISTQNGKKHSPAADAGFEIGDTILQIDNNPIEKERDITQYLNTRKEKEKPVKVLIKRGDNKIELNVVPVLSEDDGMYKIGLWVRDSIAGVGTMTFYDPKSKAFGALGHGITDIDSGMLVDINKGSILKSTVASVQKARKTIPGEIVGLFYDGDDPYGSVDKNTAYGIYGKLNRYKQDKNIKPISIGLSHQVKEGPAKILTTIEGSQIEEYDIEIQKVNHQNSSSSKSMLIKITDPRLLEKTGGIVQGMSGSPIIQDDRLIGAVTHVLINDPSKGYGIFIEWMLKEAEIDIISSYKAVAGQ